jgi:hypothetical protein
MTRLAVAAAATPRPPPLLALRLPEPLAGAPVLAAMAEFAIHPPVHLRIHPDEPIRSLEAALKVVQRHAGEHLDRRTESLLHRLESASTPQEADAAGNAFRAWAGEHGLLLIPPEDTATRRPAH